VSGWLRAFVETFSTFSLPICLSDFSLAGNPLIYVNEAWCESTGYAREDVLGHNCRHLQGPETEAGAVREMVDALRIGTDVCQ
jgi:PAS domain S-box-containing protein